MVRVIQKPRKIQLRNVVEISSRDRAELALDDLVRLLLNLLVLLQNLSFRGRKNAIETPQHRERQYHFAVLVSLVRPSEEVADIPDKRGELLVRLNSHWGSKGEGNSAEPPQDAAKNRVCVTP